MAVHLKRLADQVVVITGASSGIGLVTARMAAGRGAKVVLAARNDGAVRQLADEIGRAGGQAEPVPADVGREDDVRAVARAAVDRFGGFDTWVNNAGTSIIGEMLKVSTASTEDHRKLFDTNFWGVVYGSLEAARHLRRGPGGAIVNVGSEVSDRAVPVQGMYATSKHAVRGFTDALRMELEAAGDPVSVSLVKPAAINTPFPEHARNYMEEEPTLPPPLYAPEEVAEAILHCCETPTRDLFVGGAAAAHSALGGLAPRVTDWVMEHVMIDAQKSGRPANRADDALHRPTTGLLERGAYAGPTRETSTYTRAAMNPAVVGGVLCVTAGVAAAALLGRGRADGRRG